MFKHNNENTRTASMASFWCFIVNFEHISHLFLEFLLINLSKQILGGKACTTEKGGFSSKAASIKQNTAFMFFEDASP